MLAQSIRRYFHFLFCVPYLGPVKKKMKIYHHFHIETALDLFISIKISEVHPLCFLDCTSNYTSNMAAFILQALKIH